MQDENGVGLSDTDIRAEVNTFMFAGHHSTASSMFYIVFVWVVNSPTENINLYIMVTGIVCWCALCKVDTQFEFNVNLQNSLWLHLIILIQKISYTNHQFISYWVTLHSASQYFVFVVPPESCNLCICKLKLLCVMHGIVRWGHANHPSCHNMTISTDSFCDW